eukprot:COSAG01_NODE_1966_length_8778_cov_41.983176_8_plen_31_part_00
MTNVLCLFLFFWQLANEKDIRIQIIRDEIH